MDKGNVICIHNGIVFTRKKNEIPSFPTTWLKLKIIMVIEITQAQKDKHFMSQQ
jgi:hypothetical protein